jgi:hypothetical protein
MIYLNIDENKDVYIQLQDSASNQVNPYYTWSITNKQSLANTIFYQSDISAAPWYYSTFNITVSSTQSGLTAGIINVESGEYTYEVYEMAAPYDLDLNNAIQMVHTGIMIVNATYSAIQTYTASSGNITVYNNLTRSYDSPQ